MPQPSSTAAARDPLWYKRQAIASRRNVLDSVSKRPEVDHARFPWTHPSLARPRYPDARERSLVLIALIVFLGSALHSTTAVPAHQPDGPGRVTVTVTTLDGTIRMPGVQVELRAAADSLTIAQTATNAAGQVTFPDVPAGRYMVAADPPRIRDHGVSPFEVQGSAVGAGARRPPADLRRADCRGERPRLPHRPTACSPCR